LLVVIAIIAVLIAFLLPAVRSARGAAYRSHCSSNLKQIALALHNYHDTFGAFPPAYVADESGKPMHSWRVLILPFLESSPLYDKYRFDEPWDGPNNRQLLKHMPYFTIARRIRWLAERRRRAISRSWARRPPGRALRREGWTNCPTFPRPFSCLKARRTKSPGASRAT
jgi:hypothetical protein